jgi:3-phosphoshikimate 1-carboxyvinyltransferase
MESLEITPLAAPLSGSIRPPGSKSITNRALVCAALAQGESVIRGALDSEDTQLMVAALRQLGVAVEAADENRTLRVTGCDGRWPAKKAELFVGNSGTTVRFLTAALATGQGTYRLDGVARMRERPIGDLVAALRGLGVDAKAEGPGACPPVAIRAAGLPGGSAEVAGDVSSQFLSGLMLAGPYAQLPLELHVTGELVSQPYVIMTQRVMEAFGAQVSASPDLMRLTIANDRRYVGRAYDVEPDASAASYFFAAAAVSGGRVTVEGLGRDSLQGDMAFCDCLEQMGARVERDAAATTVVGGPLRGIAVDMNAISDTVPTLAVAALLAEGPTRIHNVAHIRHKETDRIAAVACELRKLGATVEEHPDGMVIHPGPLHGASIATYGDHRMAMSFAIAGLKIPGVCILDPGCTAKTYPQFFADLARLRS